MKLFKPALCAIILALSSQVQAVLDRPLFSDQTIIEFTQEIHPAVGEAARMVTIRSGLSISASFVFEFLINKIEALPRIATQQFYARTLARLVLYFTRNNALNVITPTTYSTFVPCTCKTMLQVIISFALNKANNQFSSANKVIAFLIGNATTIAGSTAVDTIMSYLFPPTPK